MSSTSASTLRDDLFDVMLAHALRDAQETELSHQDAAKEKLSRDANKRIARAIRRRRAGLRALKAAKMLPRFVAILLIISGGAFCAFLTIPSVQAAVGGIIVEMYEKFMRIEVPTVASEDKPAFDIMYVPDGFNLIARDDFPEYTSLFYVSDDATITVYCDRVSDGYNRQYDNEGAISEMGYVRGYEGIILFGASEGDDNMLIWVEQDHTFSIIGAAPIEELWRISNSIIIL